MLPAYLVLGNLHNLAYTKLTPSLLHLPAAATAGACMLPLASPCPGVLMNQRVLHDLNLTLNPK
jgi:hypothetical protein